MCLWKQEFQELRTTLQQQQEDVTASLKNLGVRSRSGLFFVVVHLEVKNLKNVSLIRVQLQDVSEDVKDSKGSKLEGDDM